MASPVLLVLCHKINPLRGLAIPSRDNLNQTMDRKQTLRTNNRRDVAALDLRDKAKAKDRRRDKDNSQTGRTEDNKPAK